MSYQATTLSHRAQEDQLALRLERYRRRGVWISHDREANLYYWVGFDGTHGGTADDLFALVDALDRHFEKPADQAATASAISERLSRLAKQGFEIRHHNELGRYVWSNEDETYGGSATELGDLLDCIDRYLSREAD